MVKYLFRIIVTVFVSSILFGAFSASAQFGFPGGGGGPAPSPVVEWEKRQGAEERLTAFGDDMFGDQIDPSTGTISFSHTDISIPGNSSIPVALVRQRSQGRLYKAYTNAEFGDWEYAVPRMKVLTAANNPWGPSRCTQSFSGQFPSTINGSGSSATVVHAYQYSNGITVQAGGSSSQLLETPSGGQWPSAATHVTKGDWYFKCGSASDGGQGFIGYAPNGFVYRFDRVITHDGDPMSFVALDALNRKENILAATQVTDAHGNWVKYDYDSSGRLTKIHSNDGRQITLAYQGSSKLVQSATANGRTWNYAYRASTFELPMWQDELGLPGDGQVLSTVTQPNGRQWSFTLDRMTAEPSPSDRCINYHNISLTHPTGASAAFVLWETAQRQSINVSVDLQSICPSAFDNQDPNPFPNPLQYNQPSVAARVISVIKKTITGPSIPTAVWDYTYEDDKTLPDPGGERTNWTKVDGPGVHLTYYHKWLRESAGGSLVKLETRETETGPILQSVSSTHIMEAQLGVSAAGSSSSPPFRNRRMLPTQQITLQGSDSYTTAYTYETNFGSSNYSFGFPLTATESSNTAAGSRTGVASYIHKTSPWMPGLTSVITRNGKEFERHTYNSPGQRLTTKTFGSTTATYTYAGDGTLTSFKDALNRTTSFASYKRGTPRTITLRDGNTITKVIDDNGWTTSETNPKGTTTGYGYNNMGWLTSINRPGSWADTSIAYSLNNNGGSQTLTHGNRREIVTYDNFYRPTLVQQTDLSGGASPVYVKTTYDGLGRAIFSSFPSASSNPTAGTNTTYDGLGRVTQTQETVAPNATTAMAYLSGNKTRVTDPSGAQTTTTYRAFGAPATDEAMQVLDATGTTTTMTRDIYGNILTLNQASGLNGYSVNVTRNFWYDARLRLCRHRAPEFGDELFAYDVADQMISASRGESSGSSCTAPSSGIRTSFTYDVMGRQTLTNFPTGTADIAKTYDANGNLLTSNRGGVNWTYSYNDQDMMTQERLTLDGRTYTIGHGYDTSGNVTSRTLPDSSVTQFSADGFGRMKQVSRGGTNYISAINYHPSGQVSSANYGNGRNFTQTLTARLQPYDLKVQGSGGTLVNLRHAYDVRGKVSAITDYAVSGQNRSFTYDGRGRLITANGAWGSGSFEYDGLDNIRQKVLGSRTVEMSYDTSNRLASFRDTQEANVWQTIFHDTRGNMIDNGFWAYGAVNLTYDWANQPTSMVGSGLSNTYRYDGNLKRVRTIQNGKTTYWVYSALTGTPVYQDEASDNVQTHYLSGGGASVRIRNGVAQYTHSDHLGSPVAASAANASTLWREHYTPFGEKTVDPAGNRNDVGYTGHVQDDASGLTYMQARFYDPVIGRFLSTDPIGYQDQINQYAYCANDPVNCTDPTGEQGVREEKVEEPESSIDTQALQAVTDGGAIGFDAQSRGMESAAKMQGSVSKGAQTMVNGVKTLSNSLTAVSAIMTASQTTENLSDGEFSVSDQGDLVAGAGSLGLALAAGASSNPYAAGAYAVGSVAWAAGGDELYEAVANGVYSRTIEPAGKVAASFERRIIARAMEGARRRGID